MHGFFEGEVAVAHRVAHDERRVRRAAHHVEVGARVGAADHGPRIAPHVDCASSTSRRARGRRSWAADRCAARRRPRCRAARRTVPCPAPSAMSPIEAAFERLGLRRERLRSPRAAASARGSRARPLPSSAPARRDGRARSGSLSARIRSGTGSAIVSRHPGSPSSTKPVRNDNRIWIPLRQRERDDARAPRRGAGAGVELLLVHAARRDAEHVPVERTVGGDRHLGQEVDVVVAEPVEATGDDQLELRARVAVQRSGQPQELVAASRRATAPDCRRRRCACGPARWRSPSRPRRARRAAGVPSR